MIENLEDLIARSLIRHQWNKPLSEKDEGEGNIVWGSLFFLLPSCIWFTLIRGFNGLKIIIIIIIIVVRRRRRHRHRHHNWD